MNALGALLDLAQRLKALDRLKRALLLQKDESYDALVTVLGEISKVYEAISQELTRYLAIQVDPADPARAREDLLELEGGQIRLRVGEARGHCHKISNIYHRYLSPWFRRVLNDSEFNEVQELFGRMADADGAMLASADYVADWIGDQATATLDLVDSGKADEANARIRAARRDILDSRKQLTDAVVLLQGLQAEFIAASGVV